MVNFGPLTAEIGSVVWGSPANVNGFHVSASLLQRRRSSEANQTLHDVWPSPWAGTLHMAGRSSRWASAHISSLLLLQRFCYTYDSCTAETMLSFRHWTGVSGTRTRARASVTMSRRTTTSFEMYPFAIDARSDAASASVNNSTRLPLSKPRACTRQLRKPASPYLIHRRNVNGWMFLSEFSSSSARLSTAVSVIQSSTVPDGMLWLARWPRTCFI